MLLLSMQQPGGPLWQPPSSSPQPVPWTPLLRIERACLDTIAEGKYLTRDLGGRSGCSDFTKAIIGNLK